MSTAIATNLQPIPYLAFGGNCEEAMRFYESTFGGHIVVMLRGKDTPGAEHMPPDMLEGVVNCQLVLPGGGLLFAGDAPTGSSFDGIKGVTIALIYPTSEEGEKAFNALSDGGSVSMPWAPTFWAKGFGMCTDKFGTPWVINGEMQSF